MPFVQSALVLRHITSWSCRTKARAKIQL